MARPRYRRRSRPTGAARRQVITFHNIQIASATLSTSAAGTAGRLTNLTNVLEALPTPDIDLLRSKLVFVRGQASWRPSTVGTPLTYHYGLFIGPDTLDAADIDPSVVGVEGKPYWAKRAELISPDAHLRSVTATTFENELAGHRSFIRTRGQRRIHHFGESLWFAESVLGQNLIDNGWLFSIGVQLP